MQICSMSMHTSAKVLNCCCELPGCNVPVADVLCAVCIVKRAQCLLLTLHSWGDGGYDASLGAPTKGVTQQPGQFAVTVRYVA